MYVQANLLTAAGGGVKVTLQGKSTMDNNGRRCNESAVPDGEGVAGGQDFAEPVAIDQGALLQSGQRHRRVCACGWCDDEGREERVLG